jgi:hypothetical protein
MGPVGIAVGIPAGIPAGIPVGILVVIQPPGADPGRERRRVAEAAAERRRTRPGHIVASRLDAAVHPRRQVVPRLPGLDVGELTVLGGPDGALHDEPATTVPGHVGVVDLFHRERDEQVAEVMQAQHRDRRPADDLRDLGQPFGEPVLRVGERHPLHRAVDVDRGVRPVVPPDVRGDQARVLGQGRSGRLGAEPEQEVLPDRDRLLGAGPRPARAVDHDRPELLAEVVGGVWATRLQRVEAEGVLDLRHRVGQVVGGRGEGTDPRDILRDHVVVEEEVEEGVIAQHPAHRQRARVQAGELLDRPADDVPAHGHAGDHRAARPVHQAVEQQGEVAGAEHAGPHVVGVVVVRRGRPRVPLVEQFLPQPERGRVDGEDGAVAAEAVRPHHELAVPLRWHLDVVGRVLVDTLQHARRHAVHRRRRERRVVDGEAGQRLVTGHPLVARHLPGARGAGADHAEREGGAGGKTGKTTDEWAHGQQRSCFQYSVVPISRSAQPGISVSRRGPAGCRCPERRAAAQ